MDINIDLSIIIVNWNTKELLRDCLNSMYAETKINSFEVFVVDNASSDSSARMVELEFPQVNLIKNREDLGFAKASNQAIRKSKGRYILLLGPDTIVFPNTIDKMVIFMNARTDIGALGCKILYPNGAIQPSVGSFPTLTTQFSTLLYLLLLPLARGFRKMGVLASHLLYSQDYNDIRGVDSILGACMLVRREVINQVGLLDEQFFMYAEEVDWCYRINQAGWKIYFFPDAKIVHYGDATTKEFILAFKWRCESLYKFFKKHYGRPYAGFARITMFADVFLRIGIRLIQYPISQCDRRKQIKWSLRCYWEGFKYIVGLGGYRRWSTLCI